MPDFDRLPRGTQIIDRDGRAGAVVNVTEWKGSTWYDVRFSTSGVAVRYPSDIVSAS